MLDKFRFPFFLILMFSYSNFIIYDFYTLSYNPDSGTEFIPNSLRYRLWDKISHTESNSIILYDIIYLWKYKI
jgi:hypothetical protein